MHMTVPINQRKPGHDRLEQHRFLEPFRDLFTHREDGSSWPRWQNTAATAPAYLRGLLGPGAGKNMHGIAKRVDRDDDQIERFVRESPWEHEAVQTHLVNHVPKQILNPHAVLNVDDVALVKKGKMSVAAYRQYCGATGKVDECQVAVDVIYTSPDPDRNADQKTWPLGMQLYVPQGWLEDSEYDLARDAAQVPADVEFLTKHDIALQMIDRARHLPHAAIGGDAGYGDNGEFRRRLRERNEPYVLGVTPSQPRLIPADTPIQAPQRAGPQGGRPETHPTHTPTVKRESPRNLAQRVTQWETIEWSEGTKGHLTGEFWRTKVRVVEGPKERRWVTDEVVWLVLEKRSNQLKAYLCWGFDDATLEELVGLAHSRWTIEQFHREAKQMLGLDQFEGRSWKGWHHHVTMVLLAYAYLALHRAQTTADHPPTLPKTANAIVLEIATQRLVTKHRLKRPKARKIARTVLLEFSEWED